DAPYEAPLTKKEQKPVFPHNLSEIRENGEYGLLLKTPFGNTLTRLMAQDAIMNTGIGRDSITDFLALSFSSTDYVGHHFGINAIELEDTYYRLDRDLDSLFQTLDKTVGKDNYIVFLTADHGCAHNPQYLIDNHMKAGFFKEHQMLDSLNQTLVNTYKQEGLIKYVENQQIYLDDALIAKANLNKESIIQTISETIKYFEGIEGVITANQIINNQIPGALFDTHYQKGFRKEKCGDIYYKLLPGWMVMPRNTGTTHGSPYDYDTHIPFLLMGKNVVPDQVNIPVSITDIAPTICNLLNIQLPDGCTGKNVYIK
ncbi:MAG: alkaline phosphatase family protein, partial [Bacteroidetes bacterium]|nr:alkaline phosphatase family protein [Bacteroidota bacterium]